MTWISCELHAHTLHSDGRLTLEAMAREVADRGVAVVALTDHNTTSGLAEIPRAERASGVTIIPGMELTTFYGHLLSLGTTAYVEWRGLSRGSIHAAIDAIHAAGGLAGVAHPFHPGSPFCTGCFWEYEGLDWRTVDYLEAWSEPDPWSRSKNLRAFRLWDELLDSGHRLVAVSGTDLHAPEPDSLPAVTYAGIARGGPGGIGAAVRDALRAGRVFVTVGPRLHLAVRAPGTDRPFGPGESVPSAPRGSALQVDVAWDAADRRRLWEPYVEILSVEVRGNQGLVAAEHVRAGEGALAFSLSRGGRRWIRAELHGRARGSEAMLAFTNPVYLD